MSKQQTPIYAEEAYFRNQT